MHSEVAHDIVILLKSRSGSEIHCEGHEKQTVMTLHGVDVPSALTSIDCNIRGSHLPVYFLCLLFAFPLAGEDITFLWRTLESSHPALSVRPPTSDVAPLI